MYYETGSKDAKSAAAAARNYKNIIISEKKTMIKNRHHHTHLARLSNFGGTWIENRNWLLVAAVHHTGPQRDMYTT
jgi:hypothetical protein